MSYKLEQAIQDLSRRKSERTVAPVNLAPGCTFGALVDERLKDLAAKVEEVRGRLNTLIFTVVAAIVVEIVMKLFR